MVRPRRPPPQPLNRYARRAYRWLFRLALGGPLWVPLAMAAAGYLIPIPLPMLGGGGPGLDQPWHAFSLLLAAGGLLIGLSAWPARYRLHRESAVRREIEELRRMPREEVAELVGEAYRRAGYSVIENRLRAGAGVDLELRGRRGTTTLVQCRHRDRLVDVRPLSDLCAAMRTARAERGIVLTTGHFTEHAGSFARVHGISIVEGRTLLRMVRATRSASMGRLVSD